MLEERIIYSYRFRNAIIIIIMGVVIVQNINLSRITKVHYFQHILVIGISFLLILIT